MNRDEYNAKRKAREDKAKPAKEERDGRDLAALDAMEEQYGNDGVRVIDVPCGPPLPGIVIIKPPEPSDYDLWQSVLVKPSSTYSDKKDAHGEFTRSVLLYPDHEVLQKMIGAGQGGLITTITAAAAKFAAAGLEARGKE
jgi:hypothetical protein